MKFTKRDLFFSIITGFTTGFIAWRIFIFLNVPTTYRICDLGLCWPRYSISWLWLVVIVPVLWILGINLGYFLGRWFGFFNQFGKFSAIGFTNAAVDFGILNLLIFYSGAASGVLFSVFKGISFVVAAIHSYLWNKYWVFDVAKNGAGRQEFFKFFGITVLALLINVAAASIVVNIIGPQFDLTGEAWANVGAVIGSAVALIVSFVGFRMFVFRK